MNDPRDADEVNEANTRLVAGLKSCRSVVESYRAMLSRDQEDDQADAPSADEATDFDIDEGKAP